jgi:hypothetical protein
MISPNANKTLTTSFAIAAIHTILHTNPAMHLTSLHPGLLPSPEAFTTPTAPTNPASTVAASRYGICSRSPKTKATQKAGPKTHCAAVRAGEKRDASVSTVMTSLGDMDMDREG